jgi:EmrB/QacA subfamily drug resistance transporter
MYLAAMENTVVTTAMPTVVAKLGGLEIYSWVFSIYLLTATVSIPVWGRLSDMHGRRRLYLVGIGVFLFGSLLCGLSASMFQLVLFRAVQGIGAGALVPIALTIIGEIYTFDERGRMQAVFSSIWGFASITGPILGGFIADHFSWRWVFFINLPIGLAASIMVGLFFSDHVSVEAERRSGLRRGMLMAISLALFLLYLMEAGEANQWLHWKVFPLLLTAVFLFVLYLNLERRSEHPFIPPQLFRYRMFVAASANGLCIGMILFGLLAFLPLFVQVVLRGSATEAGRAVTPLLLTWVAASVILGRLLRRTGFRKPALYGMLLLIIGTGMMALSDRGPSHHTVILSMTLLGAGMGMNALPMLMAVQSVMPPELLGIATSATQFFRSIGGAFGVAIVGSAFHTHVSAALRQEPAAVAKLFQNPEAVMYSSHTVDPAHLARFREIMASGLQQVFLIIFVLSLVSFISVFLVPREVELLAPEAELKEPTTVE